MAGLSNSIRQAVRSTGFEMVRTNVADFHSHRYLRHNARRLEHLASLNISVAGQTVLEVGAGVGDHSHYFIDRGCRVTITEVRVDNLKHLRSRYPDQDVRHLDLEHPSPLEQSPFDIVHCYGLLYHVSNPGEVLDYLSKQCRGMLLLETRVSYGDEMEINLEAEKRQSATQASSGTGCRPTRRWLLEKLKESFGHVYVPLTQPNHEEFPLDWSNPPADTELFSRAIFIASREPLENPRLTETLIDQQARHA